MAPERRRVAVTGLGAITPLGEDPGSTWEGMLAGRSGVGRVTDLDVSSHLCQIAGRLEPLPTPPGWDEGVFRGLGALASPRTFGHGGVGSSYCWGDPVSGVSFAYLTNSRLPDPWHSARLDTISNLVHSAID